MRKLVLLAMLLLSACTIQPQTGTVRWDCDGPDCDMAIRESSISDLTSGILRMPDMPEVSTPDTVITWELLEGQGKAKISPLRNGRDLIFTTVEPGRYIVRPTWAHEGTIYRTEPFTITVHPR